MKRNERHQEINESKRIKSQKSILKKEQNEDIVEKIIKNIELLWDGYKETVEPANFEEVSRRFSMLTRPFVTDCLGEEIELLQNLKIPAPPALLAARTIKMMKLRVLIIPQFKNSICAFIREKIADAILQTLKDLSNKEEKAADGNKRVVIIEPEEMNDESERSLNVRIYKRKKQIL